MEIEYYVCVCTGCGGNRLCWSPFKSLTGAWCRDCVAAILASFGKVPTS